MEYVDGAGEYDADGDVLGIGDGLADGAGEAPTGTSRTQAAGK